MATTKTQIFNLALAHIGEPGIANFQIAGAPARNARLIYDDIRDQVIHEFPWNFATRYDSAAALAETPSWHWQNAYVMPSDYLRVLRIQGDLRRDWEVADMDDKTVLMCNISSPINFKYIRRVTNVSRYSPNFVSALAARLAIELVIPLGKRLTLMDSLRTIYMAKMSLARTVDSQEKTPEIIQANDWTDARMNSGPVLARLTGAADEYDVPGQP